MPHHPRIILASTSIYRRDLLSRLGIPFETAKPGVDETPIPRESPRLRSLRLAEAKAKALATQYSSTLIIGSDQVAHVNGEIIDKPGDYATALLHWQVMKGKEVLFDTAVCLFNTLNGHTQSVIVPTRVTLRDAPLEEIENYLRFEQPYGCAGAAKVEGAGIALIERVDSPDPTALIGLPLIALCAMLRTEKVSLFHSSPNS